MAVPLGHLTPQRRETLDKVFAEHGTRWTPVVEVLKLVRPLGILAVRARLNGLAEAGYMERRIVTGPHGNQLEFRITPIGEQHAKPVE
jgi:hypothetical protein